MFYGGRIIQIDVGNSSKENRIKFSYGHPFGKATYIFIGLVIFVGFGFCVNGEPELVMTGIILLGSGIWIATFSHGLLIDTVKKKYCFYGPLKTGIWKDLSAFTDIYLLSKRYSSSLSYKGAINTTQSDTYKEVYLMDKYHLRRLYLETISDNINHQARLNELAVMLGAEIKIYNPATRRKPR